MTKKKIIKENNKRITERQIYKKDERRHLVFNYEKE